MFRPRFSPFCTFIMLCGDDVIIGGTTTSTTRGDICIFANNGSMLTNGSEAQVQVTYEMLRNLGYGVRILTHAGREARDNQPASGLRNAPTVRDVPLEEFTMQTRLDGVVLFIYLCHIVEDDSELSKVAAIKLKGVRVVSFHCGQHMLFDFEDVVFNKHNVTRLLYQPNVVAETWCFPMHYGPGHEFYEALTGHTCRVNPYGWSPTLMNRYMVENDIGDITCRPELYASNGRVSLLCFTPNLNITKLCLVPLLIMDQFYKRHPDRVETCIVMCAKHLLTHQPFRDFLTYLSITKDKKLQVYPRLPTLDVLKQLKEKDHRAVIITHQLFNSQNYLDYEILSLGYPLLHNSGTLRTAGAFYRDFFVHDAVRRLQEMLDAFGSDAAYTAEYAQRAKAAVHAVSTSNPNLLRDLDELIQNPSKKIKCKAPL